ncbi:MAG: hypothetical protein ACFB50_14075, partial [Rubrobacteraceae bacterium]
MKARLLRLRSRLGLCTALACVLLAALSATAPATASDAADCERQELSNGTYRAVCNYSSGTFVNIDDLGASSDSGIWLQAWGGKGGKGNRSGGAYYGGEGGDGGYAQSYYESLDSLKSAIGGSNTLYYYLGDAGHVSGSTYAAGGGGASTVVSSVDITGSGQYSPCINQDTEAVDGEGNTITVNQWTNGDDGGCNQSVFLIAGGGGGGGQGDFLTAGGDGGGGGKAIAETETVAAAASDGKPFESNSGGGGGFNGDFDDSGRIGGEGAGGGAGSGGYGI